LRLLAGRLEGRWGAADKARQGWALELAHTPDLIHMELLIIYAMKFTTQKDLY
jgi:hypothetical protein